MYTNAQEKQRRSRTFAKLTPVMIAMGLIAAIVGMSASLALQWLGFV